MCVITYSPPSKQKRASLCWFFPIPDIGQTKTNAERRNPIKFFSYFCSLRQPSTGWIERSLRSSLYPCFLSIYTHTRADTNTHTHEITCVSESKEMGGAASWVAIEELEENPKAMLVRKDSARDGWKHVGFLLYTYKQHTPCTKSNGTSRWWCPAEPGKATKTHKNKWRGRETF